MFQLPATVVGLIGGVLMVASFAPGVGGHEAPGGSTLIPVATLSPQRVVAEAKADRLGAPLRSDARQAVSIVELVGISQATLILKDENGRVLYRSDPRTNTTTFSKNTDLPVVTLKEEQHSPTTRRPVSRENADDGTAQEKRPTKPFGCVGTVSPLTQAGKEMAPELCLTVLEQASPVG